jgi:hypothetical protein
MDTTMTTNTTAIEGDRVLYVLAEGRNKGEVRGAIVTKSWSRATAGVVNLTVFTDFSNDFYTDQKGCDGLLWRTSVSYSETKEPGTWHWPSEA